MLILRLSCHFGICVSGEDWRMQRGKQRLTPVHSWGHTENVNTPVQEHHSQRCLKHTCCCNTEGKRVLTAIFVSTVISEGDLGTTLCTYAYAGVWYAHKHARACACKDTYACSQERAKPCKSPDVQDETGGDEKGGTGRRSGVPGRREGEGGWQRRGEWRGGLGVYYCLKGSGCCVQINKQKIIAEGLYIYFLS